MSDRPDLRRLLGAHRSLLDEAEAFPGRIDLSKEPVSQWVALALFARVVHLAEAIHTLIEQGYADVAEPLTRAMVSATENILAIIDTDSDNRALAFLSLVPDIRKKRLAALVHHCLLAQDDAEQQERLAAVNDARVLDQYEAMGVSPAKIGGGKSWHGLDDKTLFQQMGAEWRYDLYYAPFSDELHVNAAALGPEINAMRSGIAFEFGPRSGNPAMSLIASNQAICQALRQLDAQRKWGHQEQIDDLFKRTREEIEDALGVRGRS